MVMVGVGKRLGGHAISRGRLFDFLKNCARSAISRKDAPIMHLLDFDTFAKTIETLSGEAIVKALELNSKMFGYDPENYRLYLPEDAYSIFCFRQFVREAKLGKTMPCCGPLPAEHVRFYRQTVERLIEADELPKSALEEFDNVIRAAHEPSK